MEGFVHVKQMKNFDIFQGVVGIIASNYCLRARCVKWWRVGGGEVGIYGRG